MIEFDIQDMTCMKCEKSIRTAVSTVDHSAEIDVDLENKRVAIISEFLPDAFENEIRKHGFTPVRV